MLLNEQLLQFIWQHRYFNTQQLTLTTGEPLAILIPGQHNTNQGPDFLQARIKINNNVWAGHIELHTHASHWHKHKHSHDAHYDNVILYFRLIFFI